MLRKQRSRVQPRQDRTLEEYLGRTSIISSYSKLCQGQNPSQRICWEGLFTVGSDSSVRGRGSFFLHLHHPAICPPKRSENTKWVTLSTLSSEKGCSKAKCSEMVGISTHTHTHIHTHKLKGN